jgi:hypothetical protein
VAIFWGEFFSSFLIFKIRNLKQNILFSFKNTFLQNGGKFAKKKENNNFHPLKLGVKKLGCFLG